MVIIIIVQVIVITCPAKVKSFNVVARALIMQLSALLHHPSVPH